MGAKWDRQKSEEMDIVPGDHEFILLNRDVHILMPPFSVSVDLVGVTGLAQLPIREIYITKEA